MRWYRHRLLRRGPVWALVPPLVIGLIGLIALAVGSGPIAAVIGVMGTVWAAPGLLAVGAPIGDAAVYPFAVLGSAVGWAILAAIAARRAVRSPVADWWDFWREMTAVYIAVLAGTGVGVAVAAWRLGGNLL